MNEVLKACEVSQETKIVSGNAKPQKEAQSGAPLVVIEARNLIRQCLTRCLAELNTPDPVLSFASLTEWRDVANCFPAPSLVLIGISGRMRPKADLAQDVALAAEAGASAPVVIFTDGEDVTQILEALDAGVRGVIPTSLSLEVANQALRLVKAGGVFVPANALSAPREMAEGDGSKRLDGGILSKQQIAVVKKLAEGKPNKIIAYELALCESTVKVHVRAIMKKLQATNRTQVAYIFQSLKAA